MRFYLQKLNIRLMALAMAVVLLLCAIPAASAAESEGSCGASLTWSFADGRLTISGSGDMTDYDQSNMAPWYSFRDQITSLSLPEGLTSVGDLAFYDCLSLTAVTIPASVTDIGELAFCQCTSLTLLVLNNGLRSIGRGAFELCYNLQDLRLPSTLTTLGENAFCRCASLRYVTVPESVTNMGSGVFSYCSRLIRAEILAPLPALPAWSFHGCTNLTSVVMADVTGSVGSQAFSGCEKLNTVYYGGDELDTESLREQITQDQQSFGGLGEIINEDSGNTGSSYTTEIDENGTVIVENTTVTQTDDATVSTSTTTEAGGSAPESTEVTATVVNPEGWDQVQEVVEDAIENADGGEVNVNIYVSGDAVEAPQDILESLAGTNVIMEVQSETGSRYVVNFAEMAELKVEESLDLSYEVKSLEAVKYEELQNVVTYQLRFNSTCAVNAEIMIQLPLDNAKKNATLLQEDKDGLIRLQSVVVDAKGIAHFYLGAVDCETEYLIGINVPGVTLADTIVPENLHADYGITANMAPVEYVITGRKSSWGMSIGQVTWIMAAVMIGCVASVGVFMFALNKRKLKQGYVPEIYDEED